MELFVRPNKPKYFTLDKKTLMSRLPLDKVKTLTDDWREQGHDGAALVMPDGVIELSVFDNNGLKSATDNNGAFDEQNPDINFARGKGATGLSVKSVQGITDAIKQRWANAPEIVVASDMNDAAIPQAVRDHDAKQRSQGATGTPEGFFYGGKVYVVASELDGPKDVIRVLFHEALGHAGLRGDRL